MYNARDQLLWNLGMEVTYFKFGQSFWATVKRMFKLIVRAARQS